MFMILITVIPAICLGILALRHFTHMLQLSSYQLQGYFRYIKTVLLRVIAHAAIPVLFLLIMLAAHNKWGFLIALSLLIIFITFVCLIVLYLPRPAKKKFVVTNRVKRLFVTYLILTAIVFLLPLLLGAVRNFSTQNQREVSTIFMYWAACAIYIGVLPFIPALANLINKPIEDKINQHFIDDAKRILKEHEGLRIIGITGSYGKTSVKYYLSTLLSESFRVLMTPESYNTPMGIVRTIREQMQPTHEIFVCEMGARHVHDIKEITDIVNPDDGIITSIGPQHLETFHSLDNIINTKYELLDAVDAKEKAQNESITGHNLKFVNGDDPVIKSHMKYPDAITYGLTKSCNYRASDLKVTGAGTTFTVTTPDGETAEFSTRLVGKHNVQNIMGAIAVANCMGVPMSKLKMGVKRLQGVPHRLELNKHGDVTILDDAYNSNPNGAKVALETLALFKDAVKILVTPGMVELGDKQDKYNKEFGEQAAAVCDYIILVGDKNSEAIRKGALGAGFNSKKLYVKSTLDEATKLMYELEAGKEKVILLENDLPDNYK